MKFLFGLLALCFLTTLTQAKPPEVAVYDAATIKLAYTQALDSLQRLKHNADQDLPPDAKLIPTILVHDAILRSKPLSQREFSSAMGISLRTKFYLTSQINKKVTFIGFDTAGLPVKIGSAVITSPQGELIIPSNWYKNAGTLTLQSLAAASQP